MIFSRVALATALVAMVALVSGQEPDLMADEPGDHIPYKVRA